MNSISRILVSIAVAYLVAGCARSDSDADNITRVLEKCAAISKRAAKFNGQISLQADFVARESQKIDVSHCPPDFRMAFQAHVFAWQQAVPALANNTAGTAFLEGLASGLTDNPGLMGQANQQAADAAHQINATYYELTQIAARYGARIPRSVVGE